MEKLDEKMKKRLYTFLHKKNLADLFSKDWLLKFISLVLAVGLWSFVGGEDRVDKNVMIPIEIINLPRDLVISNQFKKEIEVSVSGPRSMILEMNNRAITRQVDLSSATPGTMVIVNDIDQIPVPRGITVQRVQPSSIILSLDKLIQKKFPISARTVGNVADGYYIKELKMDPDVITIAGPQTILSQVDELHTRPINLEGMKQSAQRQVPLELDPAIVELIGETSVTAEIRIVLETVTRTLDKMSVHAVIDGVKRKVKPETVKVTANIPKKLLADNIDPKSLITVAAMQEEGDDQLKVKVIPRFDVEVPIEIISIVPDTVSLVDGNAKSVSKTSLEKAQNPTPKQPEMNALGTMTLDYHKDETPASGGDEAGNGEKDNETQPEVLRNQNSKRKLDE
jgi:YbbR domain-containing protein